MYLHELIDLPELGQLIDEGYVGRRVHPDLPLTILNYTPAAVQVRDWSETLSYCRGLIYDTVTLEVVAIPFKKFWNWSDTSKIKSLPEGIPAIYEKADGSYLNCFFYKGKIVVSTRGSFESEQAKWAQQYVNDNIDYKLVFEYDEKYNYIFEVIVPFDRKVVRYDFSGLVLLGCIDKYSAREYRPEDFFIPWLNGYRIAKQYGYEDLAILAAKDTENEEGFVATWFDNHNYAFSGSRTFRAKIKFETYLQKHKMLFQLSAKSIWELTKEGKDLGIDSTEPELKNWAESIQKDLLQKYYLINYLTTSVFNAIVDTESRKEFALKASSYIYKQLLFLLLDKKDDKYKEAIWKIIEPGSKSFKEE